MRNLQYYKDGRTYKRVNKTKARRLYNEGKAIALAPSNLSLYSHWVNPCIISINDEISPQSWEEFDNRVMEYQWYNCTCNETGKYANFFEIV